MIVIIVKISFFSSARATLYGDNDLILTVLSVSCNIFLCRLTVSSSENVFPIHAETL